MKLSQARANDVIIIEGEKYVLDSSIRAGNRRICVKRLSDNQIACFSTTQECILECQNDQPTYLEQLANDSEIKPAPIIEPEPEVLEDYLRQANSLETILPEMIQNELESLNIDENVNDLGE